MADLLNNFDQQVESVSDDFQGVAYAERKDRERLDSLMTQLAEHQRRSSDAAISLQGRYESSKQVVSLLYSLDAYGELGDFSLDAAIETCRELHRQCELKKEYDALYHPTA